jgi:hypothetical protein
MAFNPARPTYTLPFAGTDYALTGTMAMVEAVEQALNRGITQIAVGVIHDLPTRELVALISALLTACGHPATSQAVAAGLWDTVGLRGDANQILRVHLYSFLSICLAPPEQREAKARSAGEWIGKLVSPGPNTSASASAS